MTAVGDHYVLAAATVSDPSDVAIRVTLIAVMGSVPVFASVFVTAIVAIVVVVAVVNLVFVLEKIEHQRHIFGLKLYRMLEIIYIRTGYIKNVFQGLCDFICDSFLLVN